MESEPGRGATFFLALPIVAVAPEGASPPQPPAAPTEAPHPSVQKAVPPDPARPGSPRHRVLVAEDNPTNQALARELLEFIGCIVDVVPDGRAAVAAATASDYDLVLMDCQMPVMDGYEATSRIRAAEADTGRRLPIVALTGHALTGERERCLRAGMDDYLAKPFRLSQLQALVGRWSPPEGR